MNGFAKGKPLISSSISRTRNRRSRWFRPLLWVSSIGLLALLAWCLSLYFVITKFEGTPKPGTPIDADVGIVLGARLWNDKPSPGLRERLDHALGLYRDGTFSHFIVTGGLDSGGATITEAEGMRDYLVGQGVPEASIIMDSLSRSTYENLIFAQEIMQRHDWSKAIIVTHDYHGSRAADIAKKVGLKPVQVSVTESHVLNMAYHQSREVMAYTKWLVTKLFL